MANPARTVLGGMWGSWRDFQGTSREVPGIPADPSDPPGPFFLVGSWDDWRGFMELRPMPSRSAGDPSCIATVEVNNPPCSVEFQIVQDRDWAQRFYPAEGGAKILGPSDQHGANWVVPVPQAGDDEWTQMDIAFDPRGARSLRWRFLPPGAEPQQLQAEPQLRDETPGPFFLAGSWDDWKQFLHLKPLEYGKSLCVACIPVNDTPAPMEIEFQIVQRRDWAQRFYPARDGTTVLGPDDTHGVNWKTMVPAGCVTFEVRWEPSGPRSVSWKFISDSGEELHPKTPESDAESDDDAEVRLNVSRQEGRPLLHTIEHPKRICGWQILEQISKGTARGAVFKAKATQPTASSDRDGARGRAPLVGQIVALKFPAVESEIENLRMLANRPGVLDVIDYRPCDEPFLAMPMLWSSLEEVLDHRDHDGRGGRVSWAAARGLGMRLVNILRGIHEKGVLLCDISLRKVMFHRGSPAPHLVDFSLSRSIRHASFRTGVGSLDYLSIRAGFGGERTQADDLESVGWLLLRCVLGCMPWKRLQDSISERRRKGGDQVSRWKTEFLDNPSAFGQRVGYCPLPLAAYIKSCMGSNVRGARDYATLSSSLAGGEAQWDGLLLARSKPLQTLCIAKQGRLLWRPMGSEVAPQELRVSVGFLVRLTGLVQTRVDGHWLQVDPVWTPKSPSLLLEEPGCWVLSASDEHGELLTMCAYDEYSRNTSSTLELTKIVPL